MFLLGKHQNESESELDAFLQQCEGWRGTFPDLARQTEVKKHQTLFKKRDFPAPETSPERAFLEGKTDRSR